MLAYDLVDVFTHRPFAGNQLAVVRGADGLSSAQCLAIAREFNISETTFPASDVTSDRYRTRIFTPGGEIPFAGHPTLGTAWALRHHGLVSAEVVTQVCGAGEIPVRFTRSGLVELSATPRDSFGPLGEDLVADLLVDIGLTPADLAGPVHVAGTGLTFIHLPVTDDAVVRSVASRRSLRAYDERLAAYGTAGDPVEGLNVFAVSGSAPDLAVHSRVFVPGLSIPEDPATGSAAAGLGVVLAALGLLPEGGRYVISQGAELRRPSTIHGAVEVEGGVVTNCRVAGAVRPVAHGELQVPPG